MKEEDMLQVFESMVLRKMKDEMRNTGHIYGLFNNAVF
jgi:hypothetical protein